MKRWVWWVLVIIALVLYGAVVYDWWCEGNKNFSQQTSHENL